MLAVYRALKKRLAKESENHEMVRLRAALEEKETNGAVVEFPHIKVLAAR